MTHDSPIVEPAQSTTERVSRRNVTVGVLSSALSPDPARCGCSSPKKGTKKDRLHKRTNSNNNNNKKKKKKMCAQVYVATCWIVFLWEFLAGGTFPTTKKGRPEFFRHIEGKLTSGAWLVRRERNFRCAYRNKSFPTFVEIIQLAGAGIGLKLSQRPVHFGL